MRRNTNAATEEAQDIGKPVSCVNAKFAGFLDQRACKWCHLKAQKLIGSKEKSRASLYAKNRDPLFRALI
ncbi:MAG: hypothetical protein KDJ29_02115 [Hyphomicrobiales bacterium]|nr:hypothetical protein [Hyphomicrobiales bacterium]